LSITFKKGTLPGDSINTPADGGFVVLNELTDLCSFLKQHGHGFSVPLRITEFRPPSNFQNISERFRPDSGLAGVGFGSLPLRRIHQSREREEQEMGHSAVATARYESTKSSPVRAIVVGGFIAGTVDLLQACILFGWDIPLSIAGGLLGHRAFHGGSSIYILGVLLHFFIACSAAATYYLASRKLPFLTEYPLVCGLFFGAAVEDTMRFVVLPLSALHARGPYELRDLILGLLVHMVVVGLPISFSVRRYAR
jgi:hypothetical protein